MLYVLCSIIEDLCDSGYSSNFMFFSSLRFPEVLQHKNAVAFASQDISSSSSSASVLSLTSMPSATGCVCFVFYTKSQ